MPYLLVVLKPFLNNALSLCFNFLDCGNGLAASERKALRSELDRMKNCKPSLSYFSGSLKSGKVDSNKYL